MSHPLAIIGSAVFLVIAPGVVAGSADGAPYIIMEFIEGESLEKIIRDHRELTLAQKLDVMIQVCDALHYAH